jgi:SnoaL-like domain
MVRSKLVLSGPLVLLTVLRLARINGNADDFVNGSERMTRHGTTAIHSITPADIHLNGDKAVAESVGSIQIRFEAEGHQYDLMSYCRFISKLEKVDEFEWNMLELGVIYARDII